MPLDLKTPKARLEQMLVDAEATPPEKPWVIGGRCLQLSAALTLGSSRLFCWRAPSIAFTGDERLVALEVRDDGPFRCGLLSLPVRQQQQRPSPYPQLTPCEPGAGLRGVFRSPEKQARCARASSAKKLRRIPAIEEVWTSPQAFLVC